jgi:hypothetical protein
MSENNTTRRYPRTLAEAFPDERAEWLDVQRQVRTDLVPLVVGFVCAVIMAVLIYLEASGRLFQ